MLLNVAFGLTVGTLLLVSSPVAAALGPAAQAATLHGILGAGLGQTVQGRAVVSAVIHGRAGDGWAETPHGGVAGE